MQQQLISEQSFFLSEIAINKAQWKSTKIHGGCDFFLDLFHLSFSDTMIGWLTCLIVLSANDPTGETSSDWYHASGVAHHPRPGKGWV